MDNVTVDKWWIQTHTLQPENSLTFPVDPISMKSLLIFRHIIKNVGLIIIVTGVTTNIINVRAFLLSGLEDSVTISFFALACSDLLSCVFALVAYFCGITELLEKEFNIWFVMSPLVVTVYVEICRKIFTSTSNLIIVYLAIQRCLCVVIPLHVKGLFTKGKTRCYLAVAASFSITCYMLYMSSHHTVEVHNAAVNKTKLAIRFSEGSHYFILLVEVIVGIGLNISCMSIVLFCLVIMFIKLTKSRRLRQSMTAKPTRMTDKRNTNTGKQAEPSEDRTGSKEKQALIQVTLLSGVFVLTNLPFFSFGIANILMDELGFNGAYHNSYYLLVLISQTAEIFNASINFFVYYNFNTKFRKHCNFSISR